MNPAAIALTSAGCWGASDFLGGVTARRISPYLAVAVAHAFTLVILLLVIVGTRLPAPTHLQILLGLTAGLFGGGGLMLFYAALSSGGMGVTAAVAGVLTAAVPMMYGLHTQGLPKTHQLTGFLLAVVAIWLIAAAPGKVAVRSVWMGAVSGTCFGIYFVLLKIATAGGVVWAMSMSRISSTALASLMCCVFFLFKNKGASQNHWGWATLALAAGIGVLDTGGNMFYMLATRVGRLDVAAVLSSLYPAATILLAAWLLKERTTRRQTVGMALAIGAVVLISAS